MYNCLTELYNQSVGRRGMRMMEQHRITVPAMRRRLANAFLENSDLFTDSWGAQIVETVQTYNYQPEDYPQAVKAYKPHGDLRVFWWQRRGHGRCFKPVQSGHLPV